MGGIWRGGGPHWSELSPKFGGPGNFSWEGQRGKNSIASRGRTKRAERYISEGKKLGKKGEKKYLYKTISRIKSSNLKENLKGAANQP